jgi:hypothetical protein
MIIAVSFDGTIVEDKYPEIGMEIPFAIDTLQMLIKQKHRVILWTIREGKLLEDAVSWCKERGVEFIPSTKITRGERGMEQPLLAKDQGKCIYRPPQCGRHSRMGTDLPHD